MTYTEYNEFCKDIQILRDNINRMEDSDNIDEVKYYFLCAMERLKTIGNKKIDSLNERKAKYEV